MQQYTDDIAADPRQVGADGVHRWDDGASVPAAGDDDISSLEEAIGTVIARLFDKANDNIQAALAKRDREIESLRREIKMLRDEVGLERGLAKLRTEVEEARSEVAETRRLAPNFEGKLNVLQGQVEKLARTTSKLRAGQSQLDFRLQQTGKHVAMTRIEVSHVGEQTREVLQRLRASGFDLMDGMQPPSEFRS